MDHDKDLDDGTEDNHHTPDAEEERSGVRKDILVVGNHPAEEGLVVENLAEQDKAEEEGLSVDILGHVVQDQELVEVVVEVEVALAELDPPSMLEPSSQEVW